jgi:hypothetical protein
MPRVHSQRPQEVGSGRRDVMIRHRDARQSVVSLVSERGSADDTQEPETCFCVPTLAIELTRVGEELGCGPLNRERPQSRPAR